MSRARRTGEQHPFLGVCVKALRVALAFLIALAGEVSGAHACPHHEIALAGQPADAGLHEHDPHAGDPAGDPGHSGPCTCVGVCHGSAAAPLPSVGPVVGHFRGVSSPAPALVPDSGTSVRLLLPYVLPYANGPPRIG